jgi:hypothetical protein
VGRCGDGIWTALPKDIQVARLPIPENGSLTIAGPGLEAIPIEIGDCNHAIVYVKMINAATPPRIEIMTF